MSVKRILGLLLCLVFAFLLFFSKGFFLLDSDFGWHLQMGNFILQNGIPKTDPFSYTMPSYPFIDHEWLTNIFIALLYPKIGIIGLSMLFSFIAILAIFIGSEMMKNNESKAFFLLAASVIAPFAGIRTQVITWLLFSVILYLIFHKSLWNKYKYILPAIFIIWVNLHGGFAIGIVAIFVVLLVRIFSLGKINKNDQLVFFLCIAATFLNPYGYRIWWEVWMQMSDSTLRWTISEWTPAFFNPFNVSFLFFLSFSISSVVIYRRKIIKEELILYLGLLIASQSSIRHVPLWVICALPLLIKGYTFIKKQADSYRDGTRRFLIFEKYLGLFLLLIVVIQTAFFIKDIQDSITTLAYPVNAVKYIRVHKITGNIFSVYNWGGYLIWKMPEKKVFIDGRMPSWRWKAPNANESSYAFAEYQNLQKGDITVNALVNKYHINAFLLPSEQLSTNKKNTILTGLNKIFFSGNKQNHFDLRKEIKKIKFKLVYKDNFAEVYEKN